MNWLISTPLKPQFLNALPQLLSPDRFTTFLDASEGNVKKAVRLYAWNIEVSSAFWGNFHMLEVALRNSINTQLTTLANRPDWWNGGLRLAGDTHDMIRKAEVQAKKKQDAKNMPTLPGHVIAELTFAFWNGMLANRYHNKLWEKGVANAFPHYRGRRGDVHADLERLRMLRNRIAHHEPIFARNLFTDFELINKVLGYIQIEANDWALRNSRIPRTLQVKGSRLNGVRRSTF